MGYYVIVGGEFERPLASLGGWADFKRWLYGFELGYFDKIMHFCEYGWAQDVPEILRQLELLRRQNPPPDTAEVIDGLIETVRAAPPGSASILLTDGTVKDDVVDEPSDYLWDPGEDEEDEEDDDPLPNKPVKEGSRKITPNKTARKKPPVKKPAARKAAAKKAPTKKVGKKAERKSSLKKHS